MRSLIPFVLLASIVALTACSRAEKFEVCRVDDPKDCESYRSIADFEREQAREFARARRKAERFPFDYRDLIHALLVDYLKPSEPAGFRANHKYFVSVLGADIDDALVKRLDESGIKVHPVSLWTLTEGRNENGSVATNWRIEVSQIQKLAPDTFKIAFGYYCGALCAGGLEYTLKREGKGWLVTQRRQEWIS